MLFSTKSLWQVSLFSLLCQNAALGKLKIKANPQKKKTDLFTINFAFVSGKNCRVQTYNVLIFLKIVSTEILLSSGQTSSSFLT